MTCGSVRRCPVCFVLQVGVVIKVFSVIWLRGVSGRVLLPACMQSGNAVFFPNIF